MPEHKRTGRPSKGERELVAARLPTPLAETIRAEAARRGQTINDFLGETMAAECGVPYLNQEALPLGRAS